MKLLLDVVTSVFHSFVIATIPVARIGGPPIRNSHPFVMRNELAVAEVPLRIPLGSKTVQYQTPQVHLELHSLNSIILDAIA